MVVAGQRRKTYAIAYIMGSKKEALVEKIRKQVIEVVHNRREPLEVNFSNYLSETLGYEYKYLSTLFSDVKGITIEQYLITNRIERVKLLLTTERLSLTEIADKMHYSSIGHLSNQFKKVTGITPSAYKLMNTKK